MNYYKIVYRLPFRDFTLTEFDTWRTVLTCTKYNNFATMTFEQNMQIVYYYLACSNYDKALFFLEVCSKSNSSISDDQLIFLKILISQGESETGGCPYGRPRKINYKDYFKKLLELCVVGYRPALLFINRLDNDFLFRDCSRISVGSFIQKLVEINPISTPTNILDMLMVIERNMVISEIDDYYVKNTQTKLKRVKQFLHENVAVDDVSFPRFEFNNNVSTFDIVTLVTLALKGSTVALSEILRIDLNKVVRTRVGIKSDEYDSTIRNKLQTINNIRDVLIDKINQLDIKIISTIMGNYKRIPLERRGQMLLHAPYLINTCIGRIYDYLIDGGDNIEITTTYLNFFSDTSYKAVPRYYSLCKTLLKLCISKGFLFMPFTPSNRELEVIYKTFLNDNLLTKNNIAVIRDVVENNFRLEPFVGMFKDWDIIISTDPYSYLVPSSKTIYNEQYAYLLAKSETFYFLLRLSSLFWEVSMLVLGANFKDGILYDTFAKHDGLVDCMAANGPEACYEACYEYVTSAILLKLSNVILKHNKIFHGNLCIDMQDFTKKKENIGGYVHDKLAMFQEVCELIMPLVRDIIIHDKYKPGSVRYLIAKEDFNRILESVVRRQTFNNSITNLTLITQ